MTRRLLFSCIKNEGPFILEWLAYHRAIGFTDFLIFSNECTDGSDALLDACAAAGLLTHLPNPMDGGRGPQWAALNSKPLRQALRDVDWAAHLDVDEFLAVKTGAGHLTDLTEAIAGADAISIPWRFFGNDGVAVFEDRPITAQFTRAARYPMMFPRQALMYKTLFRPSDKFQKPGIHAPKPKMPVDWRTGNGDPVSGRFDPKRSVIFGPDTGCDLAQINHYALKSKESFLVKSARGLPNRSDVAIDLTYWVMRNFNDIEDHSARRMAPAAATLQAEWMAQPEIAALHHQTCALHRAAARELMQTEHGATLYAGISVAGSSRAPDQAETARIYAALGAVFGDGNT